MAGFFTRKHRYTTTALKLRRLVASFLSECVCSFFSTFFGVVALSVRLRPSVRWCFSFLSSVWVVAFLSLLLSSFFWVVVLSLSLFVRGAVWVVLRLLLFSLVGVASSPSSVWVVLRSLSLLVGGSFLSPLLGGALSRSPAPYKWEKHHVRKGGGPFTLHSEATQGGHIGRASPCEDRPLNRVCVRSKFSCGIVGLCRYIVFQETSRISKVAVVQVGFVRVRWRCLGCCRVADFVRS